jgi:hypothetical protein
VKQTYRVLAGLIALGVLVQAAAIGFGWFDAIAEVDAGLVIDGDYEGNAGHMLHGMIGMMVMPALGLIFLIVSFFAAKVVPGARAWAGIVFGTIVLQVALAFIAFSAPVVGALHGLNALVIFASAGRAATLTRETRTGAGAMPSQRTDTSASGSSVSV